MGPTWNDLETIVHFLADLGGAQSTTELEQVLLQRTCDIVRATSASLIRGQRAKSDLLQRVEAHVYGYRGEPCHLIQDESQGSRPCPAPCTGPTQITEIDQEDGWTLRLALHRSSGQASFGEREQKLATVILSEGARLLPPPALGEEGPPRSDLLRERFGITPREAEVGTFVSRGLSNKEIARELEISPQTVKRHVSNLLRKASAGSRTELAYRLGLL